MVRSIGKLTALAVSRAGAKPPGLYSDGGGLYLQVTSPDAVSWIFRYRVRGLKKGKSKWMGLGSLGVVTLAEARLAAADCRRQLHEGVDPKEARKALEAQAAAAAAKSITFKECAATYIEKHKAGWRNKQHAKQWEQTIAQFAAPILGHLPVSEIDTGLVLRVLEPIWNEKTETAKRLRGRIEAILDWATVRGYRKGENPARWRGHLKGALPNLPKAKRVVHHAALAYSDMGGFMVALRAQDGVAALALEITILAATRTSETRGARWPEIDSAAEVWTIPGERTKSGKDHRVPLSAPMLAILERMAAVRGSEFVFPGVKAGRRIAAVGMIKVLRRMGRQDITVHGFRSTFRDWAGDQTAYPEDVAEMALGHAIGDETEAAYRRGDMLERRRRLMDEWATFCGTVAKGGKVVPINRAVQQ
jgi:integrase